jgi:predicted secreted protein
MSKPRRFVSVVLAASVALGGALVGVQPAVASAASPTLVSAAAVGSELVIQVPRDSSAAVHLGVVVPAGAVFSVALFENPSTGYAWVRFPAGDSGPTVTFLDTSYVQDPAPPNMTGVGGTRSFRYQAGGPGAAVIGMSYRRPWESIPIQQVTIDILVA